MASMEEREEKEGGQDGRLTIPKAIVLVICRVLLLSCSTGHPCVLFSGKANSDTAPLVFRLLRPAHIKSR